MFTKTVTIFTKLRNLKAYFFGIIVFMNKISDLAAQLKVWTGSSPSRNAELGRIYGSKEKKRVMDYGFLILFSCDRIRVEFLILVHTGRGKELTVAVSVLDASDMMDHIQTIFRFPLRHQLTSILYHEWGCELSFLSWKAGWHQL